MICDVGTKLSHFFSQEMYLKLEVPYDKEMDLKPSV